MPYINKKLLLVVILLVILAGYHLISPFFRVVEVNDELLKVNYFMASPSTTTIAPIIEEFSGKVVSFEKQASGMAYVYQGNGQKILRFENFETVNGPGLSLYLSTDINSKDSINLGPLKATVGNFNYELPIGIDLQKYDTVLIWCETYDKLYSYAELNKNKNN